MKVSLFYLTPNMVGGWATYITHLYNGLAALPDVEPRIYKINRTELGKRDFGYDLKYTNLSPEDSIKHTFNAYKNGDRVIVVALQKQFRDTAARMLDLGAWLVVHDPDEFSNLKLVDFGNYITVRKTVHEMIPGSKLLLHPYSRFYPKGTRSTHKRLACSICRIDFDKKTHILLDANRLLPEERQIYIRGFDNRLYTRLKICPNYPEWVQSQKHFTRKPRIAVKICHESTFTCDMSSMRHDGGGTQYSFLEAMDAGSVNILNEEWIRPDDEMVFYPISHANCLAVKDGKELADLLQSPPSGKILDTIRLNSEKLLERHNHIRIANELMEIIQ